jgi:hypothetical protein
MANRKQRENLVREPLLFLKALRAREEATEAKVLKEGLEGKWQETPRRESPYEELSPFLPEVFKTAKGNVVRVQEILQDQHGRSVPYSTLTRIVIHGNLKPSGPCPRTEKKENL